MLNFEFYNPTKIIFGQDALSKISAHLPENDSYLLLYGGGSIKTNGVYEAVIQQLGNRKYVEFSGVPANPEYEVLLQAVEVIQQNKLTHILAVGGGSVIDGAKFLAAAALYQGDSWDILANRLPTLPGNALPITTVLTLPATASEMNSGAVISRRSTGEKLGMGGAGLFPKTSFLDPMVMKTLPKKQIANGIADAYTHVLEQYITYQVGSVLQDFFAESILKTLHKVAPKVLSDEWNYEAASEMMWSCTMALNGLIGKGVPQDWGVHAIGHEITATYGIDHARTLAIVAPSYYRELLGSKKEKLEQYGVNVLGLHSGSSSLAEKTIDAMEEFFQSLAIKTKLSDYEVVPDGFAEKVSEIFTQRGWTGLGEHKNVNPEMVKSILKKVY